MMDLENLTPAPWVAEFDGYVSRIPELGCFGDHDGDGVFGEADAEFIALARNAFDVMMRRRWDVFAHDDGFQACGPCDFEGPLCPDPFTALVEADKWMKENVEK